MHECPECEVANDFGTTLSKACWNCRAPLMLVGEYDENNQFVLTVVVEGK